MNKTIVPGEYTPALARSGAELGTATGNGSWKDSYIHHIKEQAEEDFAAGTRMGEVYRYIEKSAMALYISPDRAQVFAQAEPIVQEALNQPVLHSHSTELPNGYRVVISCGHIPTIEIYDLNNECIASYCTMSGWSECQTIAEREFRRESADAYLSAWNAAMTAIQPQANKKEHMDIRA